MFSMTGKTGGVAPTAAALGGEGPAAVEVVAVHKLDDMASVAMADFPSVLLLLLLPWGLLMIMSLLCPPAGTDDCETRLNLSCLAPAWSIRAFDFDFRICSPVVLIFGGGKGLRSFKLPF